MSSSGIFSFKSSEKVKPKRFSNKSVLQRGMSGKNILELSEENKIVNKKKIVKTGSIIVKPNKNLSSIRITKSEFKKKR